MDDKRNPRRQSCGRLREPDETLLDDLRPDTAERAVLAMSRHVFQNFSGQGTQSWIAAMAQAERSFGPEVGPIAAARLLAGLQVMRRNRRMTVAFNSPTCPGCAGIVTTEERLLLHGIMALRRGHCGAARIEFMLLCDGDVARAHLVAEAFSALVTVLPDRDTVQQGGRVDVARAR